MVYGEARREIGEKERRQKCERKNGEEDREREGRGERRNKRKRREDEEKRENNRVVVLSMKLPSEVSIERTFQDV